jgi:hypothetical protein
MCWGYGSEVIGARLMFFMSKVHVMKMWSFGFCREADRSTYVGIDHKRAGACFRPDRDSASMDGCRSAGDIGIYVLKV